MIQIQHDRYGLACPVIACDRCGDVLSESRQQIELLGELRGELDRTPQINIGVLAPQLIAAFDCVPAEYRAQLKAAVAAKLAELDGSPRLPG